MTDRHQKSCWCVGINGTYYTNIISGIAGLSSGAQSVLAHHQQLNARILFQVCIQDNPVSGHDRFATLVAISQRINKQIFIMKKLDKKLREQLLNYYIPKVLAESCNIDSELKSTY